MPTLKVIELVKKLVTVTEFNNSFDVKINLFKDMLNKQKLTLL
jgi:hypothetical protein